MIFHWAKHRQLEDFLRAGWLIAKVNSPMHHHEYGFLCVWICDCDAVIPREESPLNRTLRAAAERMEQRKRDPDAEKLARDVADLNDEMAGGVG